MHRRVTGRAVREHGCNDKHAEHDERLEVQHVVESMRVGGRRSSAQARQRHNALQAVEPNSEMRCVSVAPQRGQATTSSPNRARREAFAAGGAMP